VALADEADRRIAMTGHGRSLLVEAGAGSGKTALMAGRIALLLADGIEPKHIAAVTFTELAASELLIRVRELVGQLSAGRVPIELSIAIPSGLTETQRGHLQQGGATLDELTCSTIHGFCQRLIKPYPVEANIDPGAAVMDRNQADLAFQEITDAWLRQELSEHDGTLLAELVLQDPHQTVRLVEQILTHLRRHRALAVEPAVGPTDLLVGFREAVHAFKELVERSGAAEPDTQEILAHLGQLVAGLRDTAPEQPAGLVRLLLARPAEELCTQDGSFKAYRKKTSWQKVARSAGLSKLDGERLALAAQDHYQAVCEAWAALGEATASRVLALLVKQVSPVLTRFAAHKRRTAQLDFNDLIFAARGLLRDHEPVRSALARRFSHVLVDEFQDTDPLQTEIFWRLCGEPDGDSRDWTSFRIRPGALFLVGDPKQAIYRFRGADVAAYVQAREALQKQDPQAVLTISTNFRSRAPILTYVNERFRDALSKAEGQPGFTALDAHHPHTGQRLCVAALDIALEEDSDHREKEAEAVAELCVRLIGGEPLVMDRRTGEPRAPRPGDIALLAPTGTDLWRYEEALEHRGIAVATQAGKGLYRRQEIQDLIALTRVLADGRDTLALGALLRGPLVGLTEEELLDIVWQLPRNPGAPEDLPRLTVRMAEHVKHPLAREVLDKLRLLRMSASGTTPHDLLSQAVAALHVRAVLMQRHRDQAERALANVDLYLHQARPYAVRGLAAFAEAMTAAWSDETREVEGRPDAQEEAVALYTMHASKGLEWPIVIPINTMTSISSADSAMTTREGIFHCPVFKVRPKGYEAARDREKAELQRERIRLWYVAATRAQELLVLPRPSMVRRSTWLDLLRLHDRLPSLDLDALPRREPAARPPGENAQTREIFAEEASRIMKLQRSIKWLTPSREEGAEKEDGESLLREEQAEILAGSEGAEPASAPGAGSAVQGGRERGIILHKLLEEVLTGETFEQEQALRQRAALLIREMGHEQVMAEEVAGCVVRTLALPEVSALRGRLQAEYPVYCAVSAGQETQATAGIADAIAFDASGLPEVVIDWKSDVDPKPETLEHYRRQVGTYLAMTGAARGLIVLVTSGRVIPVARA
jgi:exodeoxyribonuclease-5